MDKYESAKGLTDEIDDLRGEVADLHRPTADEISSVNSAQKKIAALENKLCGMNLKAVIKMFDNHSMNIRSLRTGELLDINDQIEITEAVKITVPGVMEMQLFPANVDVSEIETKIDEQKKLISGIFQRYGVDNLEDLEQLDQKFRINETEIERRSERLSAVLDGADFDELETKVNAIGGEIRGKDSIADDIRSLCGGRDIIRYITEKETIIQGYINEYDNIVSLRNQVHEVKAELKQAQDSIAVSQDIPTEYANIADPENYLTNLQKENKSKQEIREKVLTAKTKALSKLESYKENLPGDPVELKRRAEHKFEETKELLGHWMHIAEVFSTLKQNVQSNPMQDLSDSFTHYLGVISDGKIASEFPNPETLDMNIYSGNNLLDYDKLSEGTKATVYLAFRLAVLDHLFPDGGVIVFDDPFTDMDEERMVQSCGLIKECAKHHQVIFLTCKEEYTNIFGGNEIRLET
ncbi:MAG: hypothetical protein LIO96_10255 [Lachnospiraceae bacterium]|nr:hypothetical protein [Lachnospiraceae bacterium]